MDQLIAALMQALADAGFACVRANPARRLPKLDSPVVCVGIKQAAARATAFCDYLGTVEDEAGTREVYGRRVDCTLLLEVVSPGSGGAALAEDTASGVLQALSGGRDGLRFGELVLGESRYDGAAGVFRCPVTASLTACFYAEAPDDGLALTDFILKGDWK